MLFADIQNLAPAITIVGIGINLLFQGIKWKREKEISPLLKAATIVFGAFLCLVGLFVYFVIEYPNICSALINLLIAMVAVGIGFVICLLCVKKELKKN